MSKMNWDEMGDKPLDEELKLVRSKPLVHNELLIQNVNTWGNVQYNIPLRLSDNETRTATSIALRQIPTIYQNLDCDIKEPLPERVLGRDMVVSSETFKTSSGVAYCVKPNPNKAMEKYDCAASNRRVGYMTDVQKRIEEQTIAERPLISDMKDHYRGVTRPPTAPPDPVVRPPDPDYIFDVIAYGRGEAPCIPEDAKGFRRLLDPYFSTYRSSYRPYNTEEWDEMKDHITFYTDSSTPKAKGFGPRFKEIWQPLLSQPHRAVMDRIQFSKEYRGVCSAHNPVQNLQRAFLTETKTKYQVPFEVSPLATWSPGEEFYLAPFAPTPYQTNLAPFMYCSDYCHINRGSPISIIDQTRHVTPHPPCRQRYIVSKDETFPSVAKHAPKVAALPF